MKTLVLQLARLGDIYQTWPVVRALHRTGGENSEIHLLTRDAFSGATEGLSEVHRNWTLDTKNILEPVVATSADVEQAIARLESFVTLLKAENFDRIINLSFSPFSSRLVAAISHSHSQVAGYTRFADGYLAIPDDASAYFYAQVGADRSSRVHLTELFAQVAGVELQTTDWRKAPNFDHSVVSDVVGEVVGLERPPIVVHLGASQDSKTYGAHKWLQVVKQLIEDGRAPVVLIGSKSEQALAQQVKDSSVGKAAIDLVGRTELRDLFAVIANSQLVIGADSAPIHIAALTGTPVLNLSFNSVNFWETGPKSPGSRILSFESANDLASDAVVGEAIAILERKQGHAEAVHVSGPLAPYRAPADYDKSQATWEWLQAIYMGQPFPLPESKLCYQGLQRLNEANELALEQLHKLTTKPLDQTAMLILTRFDEIIETIAGMVPALGVVVRWFQTERLRLGPMETTALLARTHALHLRFQDILSLYNQVQEQQNDNLKLG